MSCKSYFEKIEMVILLIIVTFIIIPADAIAISSELLNFYEYDLKKGQIAIMWLGNHQKGPLEGYASAGFIIKTSEAVIVIDPSNILSDDLAVLERINAILITHDHVDHFNIDSTIMMQNKTDAYVVANPPAFLVLQGQISGDKLIKMVPGKAVSLNGINVTAFAAEHPSEMPLFYIIEVDGFRIFDGSDSAFVENLNEVGSRVHIALVPTGDPSPTASPTDAFEMIKATKPYVVIPMHGTSEQMQKFAEIVEDSKMQTNVIIPTPLDVIIPAEVVPEYSLAGVTMIVSFLIMLSIISLKKKQNVLQ